MSNHILLPSENEQEGFWSLKKYIQILIVIAIAGIAIVSIVLSDRPKDFPAGQPHAAVLITVSNGQTGSSIAQELANVGVVRKASTLITEMIASKLAVGIVPGVHELDTHIPSAQALSELLDPKRIIGAIQVLPGSTESDVLKTLHTSSILVQNDELNSVPLVFANPGHSLEGQIAPENYSFAPKTSTHQALTTMVQSFKNEVSSTSLAGGYQQYTPYQVLTIASLLQIEADPGDFTKAAAVIYNRLKIGMALQLNSTVQYAANLRGQIGLSTQATKIDSPYNTYLHTGLPPTPIDNPSLAAINAALHPATGNWLYFITVKPHDTRFTQNFGVFEQWVALYNHNVAAGDFQ